MVANLFCANLLWNEEKKLDADADPAAAFVVFETKLIFCILCIYKFLHDYCGGEGGDYPPALSYGVKPQRQPPWTGSVDCCFCWL